MSPELTQKMEAGTGEFSHIKPALCSVSPSHRSIDYLDNKLRSLRNEKNSEDGDVSGVNRANEEYTGTLIGDNEIIAIHEERSTRFWNVIARSQAKRYHVDKRPFIRLRNYKVSVPKRGIATVLSFIARTAQRERHTKK